MLRSLLLILVLATATPACHKKKNITWMYYEETRCADRWAYTNINQTLKENVIGYLRSKGITAYEMEIFIITEPEACKACTCKTGRRFKLKVKTSDVEKARGEGLYR